MIFNQERFQQYLGLPDVLRAELLESGQAVEADLTAADLAGGFLVGNSVRGLVAGEVA